MDLGIKGLRAVLAGASRGIGRATAEALAAEGCDIALCARGAEGVDAALSSLRAKNVRAIGEAVDIADGAAFSGWVTRAAESLGGCDIFINFASAGGGGAAEETFKATFNLDLMATFRGVQAALPFLERSKAGSIVAISSTAALEDFFGVQAYNAVKAAVIAYASALSQSLAPKGIRVNTVSPGPVFIEGGAWDRVKANRPAVYESTVKATPLGRLGSAEEVAKAIVFVASPTCRYLTGANIVIDGAFTKRIQY